jgi:hypothetical protein
MLLLAAMVAVSSMAWFVSNVTVSGVIDAATILVDVIVYPVKTSGSPRVDISGAGKFSFDTDAGLSARRDQSPAISESLWVPSRYDAKLGEVVNDGTRAAEVRARFDIDDEGLADVLWYDFIPVVQNGADFTASRIFSDKRMELLGDAAVLPYFKIGAGESLWYVLIYGMDAGAGNHYQGKGFACDFDARAIQDTNDAHQDIFGQP